MLKKGIKIVFQVLPYVVAVIIVKLLVHSANLEFIPLNPIFSALIGANVFLVGFLISGVLADYKESEKLPGEIASILLTITDEYDYTERKSGNKKFYTDRLSFNYDLLTTLKKWFYKEVKTSELLKKVDDLSGEFLLLEQYSLPNYIARLKQEQNNLRKIIIRTHTIRETDFVFSGYLIAFTTTVLLIAGMIFLELEPFRESLFFVSLVTYLLVFLIRLIRDLDNPFGHYSKNSYEDVSLKPVEDALFSISSRLERAGVK